MTLSGDSIAAESSAQHTQSSPLHAKTGRRAKVACKACNARRVKCDVWQSKPCWQCRSRQTICEVMESRRGKYQRPPHRGRNQRLGGAHATQISTRATNFESTSPASLQGGSTNDEAHHVSQDSYSAIDEQAVALALGRDKDGNEALIPPVNGPEMLFARMADPGPDHDSPPGLQEDYRTLYLGEAFSLAFVVKTVCSPSGNETEAIKVHYAVPPSVEDGNGFPIDPSERLAPGVKAFLQAQGAFTLPEKEIRDELVRVFFQCVHPAYPVFDRKEFTARYDQGNLSLLVLQAVFFLAASVCDQQTLEKAGFSDRYQAKQTYYLRAKCLYDADYETDKIALTAVLFLLGFWWQKPQDEKDTWHWLGCAISLAQTLGMHRSTAQSSLSQRSRSLWKRIWWSIYVRERHAAAALGRPFRIQDENCDVEPLSEEDFIADDMPASSIVGVQMKYHVSYVIEMSKLAILLGRVLSAKFSPLRSDSDMQLRRLDSELVEWEQQLPSEMLRRPLSESLDAPFWACMLHANYHNTQILFHRPRCVVINTKKDAEQDSQARAAADATTRIAEDLLTAGTLCQGQLHLVPAIFAALGIHAIVIRRRDAIQSQVAENRSRQCMLALSELSKSWPVGGWILRLFISVMNRLTGRDFGIEISPNWSSSTYNLGATTTQDNMSLSQVPRTKESYTSANTLHNPHLEGSQLQNNAYYTQANPNSLSQQPLDDTLWADQGFLNLDFLIEQSMAGFAPYSFSNSPRV